MSFITLTFLNGNPVHVNKESIAWISKDIISKKDTQIKFTEGHTIYVRESLEEVKKRLDENN